MTRRHLQGVRPQFQKCFIKWLVQNNGRILAATTIARRTDREMHLQIKGLCDSIQVSLRNHGDFYSLVASVEWMNEIWDLLISFDSFTHPAFGATTTYTSREEKWTAELFEPFLHWLNAELVPANALLIKGTLGDSTFAQIHVDLQAHQTTEQIAQLPLWSIQPVSPLAATHMPLE